MSDTQKLAEVRQDGNKLGHVLDLVVVYLMFGRMCSWILFVVNVFQRPTNHVGEVEQRALQLMEDRNALMQILIERPSYLIPGSYDDLMT